LGVRAGWPAAALALELAAHKVGVEVEKLERLELVPPGTLEQVPQRVPGDRASAQARRHGARSRVGVRQRLLAIGWDDPSTANGKGLLEDDHAADSLEDLADLVQRERPERLDPERADPHPRLAQLVDDLPDRPENRAERDDDRLRTIGSVAPCQPT